MSVFTDSSIYKHFFFPVFLFCFGNLNKEDIDSESYVTWFCWENLIYPYFTKRFAKFWNARIQIRLVSRPQLFLIKKLILCNISSWERYALEERWKKGSKVPPTSRNLDKSSAMIFFDCEIYLFSSIARRHRQLYSFSIILSSARRTTW